VYNNTEHYPALLAPLALPRTPDRSKLFFGIHSAVLNHVRGELSLRTPIACTTTTHNFSWRVSVPYKKSFRRRKFLHGEPFKSSLKDSLTKFSLELKLQVSRLVVVLVHGQRCPSVRTTRHIRQQDDRSEPCFGRYYSSVGPAWMPLAWSALIGNPGMLIKVAWGRQGSGRFYNP
jgi:hypothetical protein